LGYLPLILTVLLLLVQVGDVTGQESVHPVRAGRLLISAGADSSAGYRWLELPVLQRRCLTWDQGILVLAEEVEVTRFGELGLLVPYSADLAGVSDGKRLLFKLGRFRLAQSLLLTDNTLSLYVTAGELEIEDGRIVYRAKQRKTDPRAQYLLLAGIVLLISVLLVRARSRLRESRAEDS
jgi:hypothetical protein